jgi:hypothetical protein
MLQRIRDRRPTHGTVVAYLALFVALATGGAYAAGQIGAGDIKDNAVHSKHIKNGQVKARDTAQGAGLEAIALVDAGTSPSFLPDVPKRGFASVTHADIGIYCLTPSGNLDPAADPPFTTVEYNYSAGENYTTMWDSQTSDCADGTYEIKTYDATDSSPTDNATFVVAVP